MSKKYSPMIRQYLEIKKEHPDTLVLFRLGDFYELFFEDAKIASRELELVLTSRDAGNKEKAPMCGVPFHSVNGYIDKLIKKGYKIAIVEQLEDAKKAKGLVKRGVVQIMTPGTLIDLGLEEKNNNYLVALDRFDDFTILSYAELSTGELGCLTLGDEIDLLINEVNSYNPKEIIVKKEDLNYFKNVLDSHNISFSLQESVEMTLDFQDVLRDVKDIRQTQSLIRLLNYLKETQKRDLTHLQNAKVINPTLYLQMDYFTQTNLELLKTLRSDDRYGSLLWVIDKTKTAMGARLLKNYLIRPLTNLEEINRRQNVVAAFLDNFITRSDISKLLQEVYDLPRLIGRISYGNANGRDLIQLSTSLKTIPFILEHLKNTNNNDLLYYLNNIETLDKVVALIEKSIVNLPPLTIKEGGLIKRGFSSDLDELYSLSKGGKEWISKFEALEKEKTGIKNLKVGFNKIFGFYIEITNSALPLVKDEFGYIRKQTLSNCERFITQDLKEKEDLILSAEEKIIQLEYELFLTIRDEVKKYTPKIQKLATYLSELDVLISFAEVAAKNNYKRPIFHKSRNLEIIDGRHPVLEQILTTSSYVENNTVLTEENFFLLITGPNMGGKSTYMRQLALNIVLAQIGSYIPASKASLPVFDKIFTRIGASDDLILGQSTFMVEMLEANHAIKHATKNSLIIFDEIGRGTSTYDGMALAQAIIEHLALNTKAFTLFSTHYHELTKLEESLPGLYNLHVRVHEEKDQITFLYKVAHGSVNRSYGINVARLAGLPSTLLTRAQTILENLESTKNNNNTNIIIKEVHKESDLENKLRAVDPLEISPLDALNLLYKWKKELK